MTKQSYLTSSIKKLIGQTGPLVWFSDIITTTEIRRFIQATMDPSPVFRSDKYASSTKFQGLVAPPLFPLTYFRSSVESHDVLSQSFSENIAFDGFTPELLGLFALPDIQLPLERTLNGGSEIEFFQLAKPGESIGAQSRIIDITEKIGRSGHLVFIIVETTFWNDQPSKLLTARLTTIKR